MGSLAHLPFSYRSLDKRHAHWDLSHPGPVGRIGPFHSPLLLHLSRRDPLACFQVAQCKKMVESINLNQVWEPLVKLSSVRPFTLTTLRAFDSDQ